MSQKTLLWAGLVLLAGGILWVPIGSAIQLYFIYLGLEGAVKLMTNYHPIVHIGSDILIVLIVGKTIAKIAFERQNVWTKPPPLTTLFTLHFIWFLISWCNPNSVGVLPSIAAGKLYVSNFLLYFFGFYLCTTPANLKKFMIPWVIVCIIQVVTSLYQISLGPSSVLQLSPLYGKALEKYKGTVFRPFGLANQPGAPAVFIMVSTPFLLYLLMESKRIISKLFFSALLLGGATTLVLCQVRQVILQALIGGAGSVIALSMSSFKNSARAFKRQFLLGIVLAGCTLIFLLPRVLDSFVADHADYAKAIERSMTLFNPEAVVASRGNKFRALVEYIAVAPLGAGLSRVGTPGGIFVDPKDRIFHGIQFFADNLALHITVDLGLPGLLLIVTMCITILKRGFFSFKRAQSPQVRGAIGVLLSALCAILGGSYGAEPILYNPQGPFFWFFSGALMRIIQLEDVS